MVLAEQASDIADVDKELAVELKEIQQHTIKACVYSCVMVCAYNVKLLEDRCIAFVAMLRTYVRTHTYVRMYVCAYGPWHCHRVAVS